MTTRARRLDAAIVGLLLGTAAVAHAGSGGFTFTPPPGWIDVSRGAPEAQRQKAPAAVRAQADNPAIAFFAIEPDGGGGPSFAKMNAFVEVGKRTLLATPAGLAETEKGLQAEFAKKGVTYRALKAEVVKVAGVTSGRLVGEVQAPTGAIDLIQYAIPGDNAMAMVTFTTSPADLARNEPIFAAAAQAIRGAVEPHPGSLIAGTAIGGALIGGIAGGIGALIAVLAKRKRKAAARPPATLGPG
jgi:hypothetical protein